MEYSSFHSKENKSSVGKIFGQTNDCTCTYITFQFILFFFPPSILYQPVILSYSCHSSVSSILSFFLGHCSSPLDFFIVCLFLAIAGGTWNLFLDHSWQGLGEHMGYQTSNLVWQGTRQSSYLLYSLLLHPSLFF